MKEINRYSLTTEWCKKRSENVAEMSLLENGDYVKFEEYEKLKAQLEKAEESLHKIQWLGHPERATFKQNEGMELFRCANCSSAEQAREYFKEKENK